MWKPKSFLLQEFKPGVFSRYQKFAAFLKWYRQGTNRTPWVPPASLWPKVYKECGARCYLFLQLLVRVFSPRLQRAEQSCPLLQKKKKVYNAFLCRSRCTLGRCCVRVRVLPRRSSELPKYVLFMPRRTASDDRINIAACAVTCTSQADLGGCISSDFHCLCTNQKFVSSTTDCIYKTCTGTDLTDSLALSQQLCAKVVCGHIWFINIMISPTHFFISINRALPWHPATRLPQAHRPVLLPLAPRQRAEPRLPAGTPSSAWLLLPSRRSRSNQGCILDVITHSRYRHNFFSFPSLHSFGDTPGPLLSQHSINYQ